MEHSVRIEFTSNGLLVKLVYHTRCILCVFAKYLSELSVLCRALARNMNLRIIIVCVFWFAVFWSYGISTVVGY